MQSPRANKGMFSRVSQGLGFGRPSKKLQRDSVPAVDSSGVRRPPVGGGSHMDEEDRFPAAQRDQPAQVQEGTEGFKASSSQPATSVTTQPASSDFSEIQPASNSEDASGQTVFAAPYKNTAIWKLMSETKGPSTTIPPSEPTRSPQTLSQQSQPPQATMAGPEPTVSQTAPTTERLQTVPGFDSKSSGQGQNMSTGGFRSSSVPSEDEVSQLYPNEGEGGQDVGGDLPEDMQIGYSGKGGGIFGSFGTPARSARPTPQAEMAGQAQDPPPSMLQLPDSEELRSQQQPEGRAFREGTPVSNSPPQSTAGGQYATPQGEVPTYTEAQPASMSQAVQTPESAASGKFMTPPESPESFPYEPTQESMVPFHTDSRPQHHDSTPQQYVNPTPEQTHHDVLHNSEHAAASSGAVGQRMTQPVDDSGSYAGGPESAQGSHTQSQVVPSGEGMPLSAEGQQHEEVTPTEGYQSHQPQQGVKSGGQGTEALIEGAQQYPATPDRFSRAPHPASPEDMPAMGAATQGVGSATQGVTHHNPPQSVPEEGPQMGGNQGVADIPNYPWENPLFDEDQPQPQQGVAEESAVQQPVFHDNPAYDEKKSSGQTALGSPMIPNRSSTHTPSQQGTYESPPQVSERQAEPRASLDVIDIPPEFDPNSISGQQGQSGLPNELTAHGQHHSETLASGPPAVTPQSVNTAAGGEAVPGVVSSQPEAYSESRGVPHEERVTAAPVTAEPQVYDNSTFEQEGQRREQPYGEVSMLSGQREHPSEAVTAANAAVEEEVMNRRQPQVESETVSNAAEDGRAPVQQPFEQQQGAVPEAHPGPTQEATAEASAVQPPQASEETVVDRPAIGGHSTSQLAPGSEFKGYSQAETTPVDTRSMLVQEGDPPMGRPVILSKEATLVAQPPSAAWGSAGSTAYDSSVQPSVSAGAAPLPASSVPVDEPVQSPVAAEAPVTEPVMMDQDPPIDPSVETAPRREPALPVSTMTGQASTGQVTNTPQLGSAAPRVTQEITPAADQPVAATNQEVLLNQPAQMDTSEDAAAPVVAPRPPPMTTEQIAAYRSGADPDFDPVERRGWWEVDLTSGGGTILPSNTRGPRRGTGRGESRLTAPAMTGAHIHPGGDPSQATHFGSIVPGGSRRQQGAEARSGGQVRDQVGGSPGVYPTPPLAGHAQPAQVATASGVAMPGGGEARPTGRSTMTTQDVAAYRPAQDPRYDPTEGRPGINALPTALPTAGNAQIENPLFEDQQQQQDISSTAFDQGNDTPPVPFASDRQQEFYSSMYGSSVERQPSSSSFSESSMSSLHPSQLQPSEYGMAGNPTFSSHPALGYQQQQTAAPSVAAASLASFYQGPFFPRKSSLTASQQLASDMPAQPAATEGEVPPTLALSSTPLLGSTAPQPDLTPTSIAVSAETDDFPSRQSSVQQHRPLNIPPPLSVSDESMAASTPVAEPTVAVSVTSTVFDDGPTFAGSPLYSPSDTEDQPFMSEDPPLTHGGVTFSSEVPWELSYAAAPIFQDNPVFSEEPAQAAVSAPQYQPPSVTYTDETFGEEVPQALSSTPMLGSFGMQGQQQQQEVLSDAAPLDEPVAYDEAISTEPAFMTDSPPLASTPILSSSGSSQTMDYTSSPPIPEPVASLEMPLLTPHSPSLHSNPIFSQEAPGAEQPQAYAPMDRQASVTLSEPASVEQGFSYSSTPIFGTQSQQPQLTVTPLQSEPSLAVPEQLTPGEMNSELAYSSQPIFGAAPQQPPAPTFMQSEPSLALPQEYTAAEPEAEFSSHPIFGEPRAWQQEEAGYSPTPAAIPMQSEPSFAVPEPTAPAQEHRAFSSQPIFGESQLQQQPQQQEVLYMPSQVSADMEVETPAVYNSPSFQSRPIFGSSSAEQAQQAHIQTVSADNPWAYSRAEREPSFALPPAVPVPAQGITFHDNSLFESAAQPQLPDQGNSYYCSSPVAESSQQAAFTAQQPASPLTPANQGITYLDTSPFASSYIGPQQQQAFSPASVPVFVSHVPAPSYPPAPFYTPEPTLGPPAPTDIAQLTPAQLDTAQHAQRSIQFSPTTSFTAPGTPSLQSGGLALYDAPPLGPSSSQFVTPVTTFTSEPVSVPEPLSDPLYDPTARAVAAAPRAVTPVPALLQPLDDPLYDPLERRPVVAPARHPVRPSILLQPLDDPLYDPTTQRPSQPPTTAAAPHAPHGPRFVAAQNSRFPQQQSDPLYDPAAVETLPGQKDVTHRGEQVGTPTFGPQQGSSTFGAAPLQPPQGRSRARTPTQRGSTEEYSRRPILGSGGRRAARTTKLSDIGRPAQAPPAPKPFVPLPVQPRAEYEMGGADVLPQDSHYVKPTPYGELGAHARSALSGAGWKTTWAMEMEDTQQQQALKYPVGPVEPKGASGYGPKAAPDTVGEPDYAALARGEPGFPTGSHMGPDDSGALTNLPPSVTGATSGLGEEVGAQPSYMQMAPPPVHPGAPVTDRGFTGPGGAAGGARRRLAGKLFERQHSLQDPSFDPVSQRFGTDEGYGVDLPAHKPANLPSGNMVGRGSTGFGSEQGGIGGSGPSQGMRASSVASGVRSPTPTPTAPHSGQEQLGYAEGMGQEGIRLDSGEGTTPQGAMQGGVAEPADRTREVNERLLMEVRRRLQEAKSQLHTGADGAPSEVDAGTPVDSPLGGRPKVLQGQGSSGTPGQYWRTLEEVEAEGNNPVSRDAPSPWVHPSPVLAPSLSPSPWVQTRGADMAPRKLFQSGGASSSMMAGTRSHIVPSGRAQQQGLNNYSAGRVHNIGGGHPHRRGNRGGNTYSWGRAAVF